MTNTYLDTNLQRSIYNIDVTVHWVIFLDYLAYSPTHNAYCELAFHRINKKWILWSDTVTLVQAARMCKIAEDDLIVLGLKYGN